MICRTNADYKRSVAASLVQGVYILHRDRNKKCDGTPQAKAPQWWNFFNFQLTEEIIDESDSSIFGAIFKLNNPGHGAPKYIIAFRGTQFDKNCIKCIAQDMKANCQISFNKLLHSQPRYLHAINSVKNMVSHTSAENIWLAGHSLGSSIAMLVGRRMAIEEATYIETYLFNPPFITVPLENFKPKMLKHGLKILGSAFKAGLVVALNGTHNDKDFVALCPWKPYLFVNGNDPICSEYIGYFEHRKNMMEFGAGKIERLAMQNSARSLLLGVMGEESEALHLLPSAHLIVNTRPTHDWLEAHGVQQWWKPDICCQLPELYQFR